MRQHRLLQKKLNTKNLNLSEKCRTLRSLYLLRLAGEPLLSYQRNTLRMWIQGVILTEKSLSPWIWKAKSREVHTEWKQKEVRISIGKFPSIANLSLSLIMTSISLLITIDWAKRSNLNLLIWDSSLMRAFRSLWESKLTPSIILNIYQGIIMVRVWVLITRLSL